MDLLCVKIFSRLDESVTLRHGVDHVLFFGDSFELYDCCGNLLSCFSVHYFTLLSVSVECWREAGAQPVEVRDPGAPEVAGQSTALFV